jgi:hypothetical protein
MWPWRLSSSKIQVLDPCSKLLRPPMVDIAASTLRPDRRLLAYMLLRRSFYLQPPLLTANRFWLCFVPIRLRTWLSRPQHHCSGTTKGSRGHRSCNHTCHMLPTSRIAAALRLEIPPLWQRSRRWRPAIRQTGLCQPAAVERRNGDSNGGS